MTRPETNLLLALLALGAAALFGPAIAQPPNHHDFADQRMLWGVPYAMDVLSNLPFAVAGGAGAWLLWRLPAGALGAAQRALAAVFFGGLMLTALGSAWYHLQPDDAGLAIDRFAMAIAFAGLLGLAAAARVSERAGAVLGGTLLLAAPAAVQIWAATGNVMPWVVVQFGGALLLAGLMLARCRPGALDVHWPLVLLAYGIAKAFEAQDLAVFVGTGGWVSGHSLKHIVAALAALPVIGALRRMQNARSFAMAS